VSRNLSGLRLQRGSSRNEEIVRYNFTERGQRPLTLLIVAILVSIWAASGVMMSLMEGFATLTRFPEGPPFWRSEAWRLCS
jgi:membrane protein